MKTFFVIAPEYSPDSVRALEWLRKLPAKRGKKRVWSLNKSMLWMDRREHALDFIFHFEDVIRNCPDFYSNHYPNVVVRGPKSDILTLLRALRKSIPHGRWDVTDCGNVPQPFRDAMFSREDGWTIGIFLIADDEKMMFELLKPSAVEIIWKRETDGQP